VGGVAFAALKGMTWVGRAVAHLVLAKQKEDVCYLKYLFPDMVEVRSQGAISDTEADGYHLCAAKFDTDGQSFWGGPKVVARCFYVPRDVKSLREELEKVAAFEDLRDVCKVASRLELLLSSASPDSAFIRPVSDFVMIPEPQPSEDSGGCGFIGEDMLAELLSKQHPKSYRRVTTIQVRIVAPALGIFKGVLCKKQGISGIQLTPSMKKVGNSKHQSDHSDKAWLLILRACPSKCSLQIGKWVAGGTPCKSFKQKELSLMLRRIFRSLGVPRDVISAYASTSKGSLRREAWLVGAADPTDMLPPGHIFVSGLGSDLLPQRDGQRIVFVTRSPCTNPEHGLLVPVVTSRPAGMLNEDWDALQNRHFGEVLFSNQGSQALPEIISEGDLDGDLYYICWDEAIVEHVTPLSAKPDSTEACNHAPTVSERCGALGDSWFLEARKYILSSSNMSAKRLIGKLYRAGEAVADESELGLCHPDAKAYFRAYVQAIDTGKHGNCIHLPEHLRAKVGM